MMWYAGIDWADTKHDVVVIDQDGQRVGKHRFAHSAEGLAELLAYLKSVGDVSVCPEHMACILETNHGLLITALLEAGLPVFPVNPKTVDAMRKPSGAKTDAIDAVLLARKGRNDMGELRRLAPDTPLIQELKSLTRDQDSFIAAQTRLVNQITDALKQYFPTALHLFTMIQQPITCTFLLAYPTLEAAQAVAVDDLIDFLKAHGHSRAATKAHQVWDKLHVPQMQADPITVRTKARLLVGLVRQLQAVMATIAQYDEEIARLFTSHADSAFFAALPGVGQRLGPRLLAEWGDDRTRYQDAASVQALAGTCPVLRQSGNFAKVFKRDACVKPFRNVLYQFAWHTTRCEPWALAYYQRKRKEGKTHAFALRALGNHWIRIVFAAWKKQQPYNAAIFVAAQQKHHACAA